MRGGPAVGCCAIAAGAASLHVEVLVNPEARVAKRVRPRDLVREMELGEEEEDEEEQEEATRVRSAEGLTILQLGLLMQALVTTETDVFDSHAPDLNAPHEPVGVP